MNVIIFFTIANLAINYLIKNLREGTPINEINGDPEKLETFISVIKKGFGFNGLIWKIILTALSIYYVTYYGNPTRDFIIKYIKSLQTYDLIIKLLLFNP